MLSSAGYKTLYGDDLRKVAQDSPFISMRKHFYLLLGKPERPSKQALNSGVQQKNKNSATPPKNSGNG